MNETTIIPGSKTPLNYRTILNVGLDHVDQSVDMVKTFRDCFDATTHKFDLGKALGVAKAHDELAVINTVTQTVSGHKTQVYAVIEQLQNLLEMAVGIATENPAAFESAAMAFLNLNAQKNGSWFKIFSQSSRQFHYQYSLFQVTQNKQTGSVISGTLSSAEIQLSQFSGNILNLTAGEEAAYHIEYQGMTFVEALQKQ